VVSAGANRHDSVLLGPTIDAARHQVGNLPADATVHLDSAYDGKPSRRVLAEQGLTGKIARKGVPAPIQVGKR
jgi:IS5 family transposase